jgi:hypothetical protein
MQLMMRRESYLTSRAGQEKVYDDLIYLGGTVFNPVKKEKSLDLFSTHSKPWRYPGASTYLIVLRILQHVAPDEEVKNEVLGSIKAKSVVQKPRGPEGKA